MKIALRYKTYPFGMAGDVIEIIDALVPLFHLHEADALADEANNISLCHHSSPKEFFRLTKRIDYDAYDDWNTDALLYADTDTQNVKIETVYSIISCTNRSYGFQIEDITERLFDADTQKAVAAGIYRYQIFLAEHSESPVPEIPEQTVSEPESDIDKLIKDRIHDLKANGYERFGRCFAAKPSDIEPWERLLACRMNETAKEEAYSIMKEDSSNEKTKKRLNMILNLPWGRKTEDNTDFHEARRILDASHYGMEDAKELILEYLVSWSYADRTQRKAPILCLVGSPGTGKTSIAVDIAKALHRKFGRISLAGVSDTLYLNGTSFSWANAECGEYMRTISRLGTDNPVILLDEIDKMTEGGGNSGRPLDSLVQVLDPQQNHAFTDQFLNIPYDLSDVFFILTANTLDGIPAPVLDRMEIVQIPSYTDEDKFHIAEEYIIPRIVSSYPSMQGRIRFSKEAVRCAAAADFCHGGVRELQRSLEHLFRKAIVSMEADRIPEITITRRLAEQWLNIRPACDSCESTMKTGIINGLAVNNSGGGTLQKIEAVTIAGRQRLVVTGLAGKVMQESVQTAMDYLHSMYRAYHIDEQFFANHTIHVHFPSGGIGKDGPSAGAAIAMALLSGILHESVPTDIAITGEITLTGRILPVGGIYEKAAAAARSGIQTLFLPEGNREDAMMLPASVQSRMKIVFVSDCETLSRNVFSSQEKMQDISAETCFPHTEQTSSPMVSEGKDMPCTTA